MNKFSRVNLKGLDVRNLIVIILVVAFSWHLWMHRSQNSLSIEIDSVQTDIIGKMQEVQREIVGEQIITQERLLVILTILDNHLDLSIQNMCVDVHSMGVQ